MVALKYAQFGCSWLWWAMRDRPISCTVLAVGLLQERAASGRSVRLVFHRNTHCLVVGSLLEPDCVSGTTVTGLAKIVGMSRKQASSFMSSLMGGRVDI